jgi:hypothetical protein
VLRRDGLHGATGGVLGSDGEEVSAGIFWREWNVELSSGDEMIGLGNWEDFRFVFDDDASIGGFRFSLFIELAGDGDLDGSVCSEALAFWSDRDEFEGNDLVDACQLVLTGKSKIEIGRMNSEGVARSEGLAVRVGDFRGDGDAARAGELDFGEFEVEREFPSSSSRASPSSSWLPDREELLSSL